jgi:hypothetical protein
MYIACLLRMNIGFDSLQGRGALQPNRMYKHSEKSAASIIGREETTVHIQAKEDGDIFPCCPVPFPSLGTSPIFPRGFLFYSENGSRNLFIVPHGVTSLETQDLDVRPVRN